MEYLISHYNYWIYILLMMVGLYAMLAKNNLIKKVIGMSIFQTAIIVFYVSIGAKREVGAARARQVQPRRKRPRRSELKLVQA